MIILKRDGKRYEINEADQWRVLELLIEYKGDLQRAIAQQFEEKFGEPYHQNKVEG